MGFAGLGRIYVGQYVTGLVYFFTLGFWGLGTIYDLILLYNKNFTDAYGRIVLKDAIIYSHYCIIAEIFLIIGCYLMIYINTENL
ncbi:TM2 domain-containing protein [Pectinatus frisingensis]|uniref:hypothetical protein n=1 Tax=Pectinatus frisingensis TaxID=865 RepID=UPI0039BEE725